jgi:hypothetical protein
VTVDATQQFAEPLPLLSEWQTVRNGGALIRRTVDDEWQAFAYPDGRWRVFRRAEIGEAAGQALDLDAAKVAADEAAAKWYRLPGPAPQRTAAFDLVAHLHRQRAFSERTFGPGQRTEGVCDHIRKELVEIAATPDDVEEWVDVILLALDGAWRSGHTPEQIATALDAKQRKNEARVWPDWRTAAPGKAIEHIRSEESSHE